MSHDETHETAAWCIGEEEVGERLDKLLTLRFCEMYSRTYFQWLIENQLVLVNGNPVKKRIKPQVGDEVEVQFVALPELQLIPQPIPLSVLYEDKALLVIDKPTGLVVHPAPGHPSGTLVNALLHHCGEALEQEEGIRPGIVHRLDRETTGVLVAAKTLEAHRRLVASFSSRQVYKEYLAVCIGCPPEGDIHLPIGRHPRDRQRMAVVHTGRPAHSRLKVLAKRGEVSLVKVILFTGRTHQIRVHLSHHGTPILGDALYGNQRVNRERQVGRPLLHAWQLGFIHPLKGEAMHFTAPLPADLSQWVKSLDISLENAPRQTDVLEIEEIS